MPDAASPSASSPTSPPAAPLWKNPLVLGAAALVVVGAIVIAVLNSGGVQPGPLNQEEAEEVAGLALAKLAADMQAPDGGELRMMSGSFAFDDETTGAGTVTMEMEWGKQETGRFLMDASSSGGFGFTFRVEGFCGVNGDAIIFGDEAYESRPDPTRESCLDEATSGAPLDGLPLLDFGTEDLPEDMEVTPNDDGTVTATFADEEGTYTVYVDAKGRVTKLEVDSEQATGAFTATYGARRTISLPETSGRIPSTVDGSCFFFDGECEYTARDGDDAPLSEIEVRIYARGATPDDDPDAQPLAAFRLDGGDQDNGDYNLQLTEDGDGLFGDGDTLLVGAPDNDHEVVVWDLWADRDVQDNPAPGPALLWVTLALVGAALLRRK